VRGVFELLDECCGNCGVDGRCTSNVVEGRCVGRFAFLAPLLDFTDFGDNGVFSL
jgi:hypothetical protein